MSKQNTTTISTHTRPRTATSTHGVMWLPLAIGWDGVGINNQAEEARGNGQQQQPPQHGPSKRRVKVVPIADVRHELTYALAARESDKQTDRQAAAHGRRRAQRSSS